MPNTDSHRWIDTPFGRVHCPRHINRINHNCGWQVRFHRMHEPYYSRFFSDNKYGGWNWALDAATEHLEQVQQLYRKTDMLFLPRSEHVVFQWHANSRKDGTLQLRCVVHICNWHKRKRIKQLYVGTKKTVTQQRVDQTKVHAMAIIDWRNKFIAEHGREQLMTAKMPESLSLFTYVDD